MTNELNSFERTFSPNTGLVFTRNKFNIDLNMGTTIINFNNDATYLNVNSGLNKNYLIPSVSAYGGYRFSKSKNIWFNYNYNYSFSKFHSNYHYYKY